MRMLQILLAPYLLLLAATPLFLRAEDKALGEKEKIEALLKHVEDLKDATFIRNDREYAARVAARFLRGKWEPLEKEIKMAKDFIEKVASTSSTTGKPYRIRFKDGREMKSGEYLQAELKKLEDTRREKDQR